MYDIQLIVETNGAISENKSEMGMGAIVPCITICIIDLRLIMHRSCIYIYTF